MGPSTCRLRARATRSPYRAEAGGYLLDPVVGRRGGVQIAVEANHHLIVMHEETNDGTDRSQLSHVANETKAALGVEKLDAVADRGYFNSEEIRACEEAGITVTLPKPMTCNGCIIDFSCWF